MTLPASRRAAAAAPPRALAEPPAPYRATSVIADLARRRADVRDLAARLEAARLRLRIGAPPITAA